MKEKKGKKTKKTGKKKASFKRPKSKRAVPPPPNSSNESDDQSDGMIPLPPPVHSDESDDPEPATEAGKGVKDCSCWRTCFYHLQVSHLLPKVWIWFKVSATVPLLM